MNNIGTINIIREGKFKGALINFNVYINNQLVGIIKNGSKMSIPVYLGNHILTLKTLDKTINQDIVLSEDKKNITIECNCKMGLIAGRPNITKIYYS